jgi:hypothetical protein
MGISRQVNIDDLHAPGGPLEIGFVKIVRGNGALDGGGVFTQAISGMPLGAQPFATASDVCAGQLSATWDGASIRIASTDPGSDSGQLVNWILIY